MKNRFFAGALAMCMVTVFSAAAAAADGDNYTEKMTTVIKDGEEAGEFPLRFYEETPNVPYMGMNEYSQLMKQQPLTLKEEDGMVILENGIGEEIRCDVEGGVITVNDWNRFFDLPLPLENEALGWKDTATRFARITDVDFEGEPEPVILDFARYGIAVHADQEDVYLPVSVLSNMMTDIATNHLLYNGEKLYSQRISLDGKSPEGFWDSEMYRAEFQGEERPEDLVKQCYADLCFNFDYFFGYPGVAPLDEEMAEKGLDQALTDLGRKGLAIKEGLLSSNLNEYLAALNKLFMIYLSDGHTVFISVASLAEDSDYLSGLGLMDQLESAKDMLNSPVTMRQLLNLAIPVQRSLEWDDENYIESGSTAIIRLDSFMPDEEAWKNYYNGESGIPEDPLGIVLTGLRRASENPDIENVIFDLTCNSGGSPDVMMAILAVTTGQTELYGYHRITDRNMKFTFEADTNLDGVYDERDKEVKYDFNYGVLTTRHAFSCGNLFPIIIQKAGAVLIGEPTSGGSCCVQVGSDAQGFTYMMSSGQWQLLDDEGNSVESGCNIDLPIETKSNSVIDKLVSAVGVDNGFPSFLGYYDEEMLDAMMKEWFADKEEAADIAA